MSARRPWLTSATGHYSRTTLRPLCCGDRMWVPWRGAVGLALGAKKTDPLEAVHFARWGGCTSKGIASLGGGVRSPPVAYTSSRGGGSGPPSVKRPRCQAKSGVQGRKPPAFKPSSRAMADVRRSRSRNKYIIPRVLATRDPTRCLSQIICQRSDARAFRRPYGREPFAQLVTTRAERAFRPRRPWRLA